MRLGASLAWTIVILWFEFALYFQSSACFTGARPLGILRRSTALEESIGLLGLVLVLAIVAGWSGAIL